MNPLGKILHCVAEKKRKNIALRAGLERMKRIFSFFIEGAGDRFLI